MRSFKSRLLVFLFFVLFSFGFTSGASAASVTVGQTASKASSTYFYYNPSGTNAYAVINNAINAAASGATSSNPGVVYIENASKPYEVASHILAKSHVDIKGQSRSGVVLKIAAGLTAKAYGGPGTTGWGGTDSGAGDAGIINVWRDVTDVTISNITLDGSCGDYYPCSADDRGRSEFNLMDVYWATFVTIDNVKFTNGMHDGIRAGGDDMEVSNSVFDMIGHDAVQGYGIYNLKFHNNIVAMRTNSGVRCAGSGNGCYVYNNEFYTGSGGGSALELQNSFSNVKIYNNYFHDISGASGSYGAIGYPGQSPSGSGHEYYNNLFVNLPYAINYVPSSSSSHHNIMINAGTAVGGGSDSNNIKTASGYVFQKYGSNKAGNTYWTVSSGSLASAFSGRKIGIDGLAGGTSGATGGGGVTNPATYTVTVNNGLGDGTYSAGDEVTIIADLPASGKEFDKWTGSTQYLDNAASYTNTFTMPAANISFNATYKTAAPSSYALTVTNGSGDGAYASGTKVTIAANAPAAGKIFDKWTGSTSYVASTTSATTTVTMPAADITLIATYKDAPTYTLTVTNGTGDGSYSEGEEVVITADNPATGKVFDKWTGSTSYITSATSATTIVTMPGSAITLTATYKNSTTATYSLTVNNGTGDGSYPANTQVTITADAPATGKVFDKWTGSTSSVASTTSATTTVTMPAAATTLTATYKDATKYSLVVTNGTGDGSYAAGTKVTIKADTPATGKVFDKWTGSTSSIVSTTAATTTVTMPASSITLVATYKNAAVSTYALTVNNGAGDGSYAQGEEVVITADNPATGKVFDKWTGSTSYIDSATSLTTTVTMPAKAITLTATYKDSDVPDNSATSFLMIGYGSGDGTYPVGTKVTITAKSPYRGLTFYKWTRDTAYISDIYSPTAVVTIPDHSIILVATFRKSDRETFKLTVSSGFGSNDYLPGTKINITAKDIDAGRVFIKWVGDTSHVDDVTKETATVTMPEEDITLVATYTESPQGEYLLTVNNGSGEGSYAPGTTITITADTPTDGKIFNRWTGNTSFVSDINSATTTVTMPSLPVILTASYRNEDGNGGNYPDGTLIKIPDSPKIYVIVGGEKKWISTPEVFEQLGYQWTEVQTIAEETLNTLEDIEDNLIRLIDDFKIYLVTNGTKRHIPNPDIFLNYGFSWDDVKDVDDSIFNKYQDVYLIRESGKEEVYYINPEGVRKHIPTAEIFNSYNDRWEDVQIVSKNEIDAYPISNLVKLEGSNDVYLVENNIKKRIPNPTIFNKYQLNWNYVLSVNETEFNWYQNGGELK